MKIHDISKTINTTLILWPGDKEYVRHESAFHLEGMTGHASWIEASLHSGSHVDAHFHYNEAGKTIDQHDLSRYIGPCQVIDVTHANGPYIEVTDIKSEIKASRILLKTEDFVDESKWTDDFKAVSVDLIKDLHSKGVNLIGLDTPSVDRYNTNTLTSHMALYQYDIYNIEGLILNDIQEGLYELVALPLKIEGGDGSLIRAILIEK